MSESIQLIFMIFGGLITLMGIALFALRRSESDTEVSLLKFKLKTSTPSLVMVIVGVAVFAYPFSPFAPGGQQKPQLAGMTNPTGNADVANTSQPNDNTVREKPVAQEPEPARIQTVSDETQSTLQPTAPRRNVAVDSETFFLTLLERTGAVYDGAEYVLFYANLIEQVYLPQGARYFVELSPYDLMSQVNDYMTRTAYTTGFYDPWDIENASEVLQLAGQIYDEMSGGR